MVAPFGSLIQPLLLLVSIPFAATGAVGLLLITDTALGVPALIGMLMLIGIVVTNAIVLIDLVNQYRRQGKSVEDSLVSGARQRLRPILMTALATIFALTPMAFGLTGDSGFISQPLAIVVIGGLISSTLLTLILVPTLYWLVEGRKERKVIRQRKRADRAAAKTQKREIRAAEKAGSVAPVAASQVSSQTLASPNVVTTVIESEPAATAEPVTQEFEPAKVAETPPLAWSEESSIKNAAEIEIDDESSMRWSEQSVEAERAKATSESGLPEFLTQEIPLVTGRIESKGEQRTRETLDRTDQKRAARESRHAHV
jgi:HAE1 family hydrophobic/amphiphilic exporter-1